MVVLTPPRRSARRWLSLAVFAVGLAGCLPNLAPHLDADGSVRLRHRAPPDLDVSVVGDFNAWQAGVDRLHPIGTDLYEGVLHLPPGTYTYAYAEVRPGDATRIVPPEAAQAYVSDDLGGRDGILRIPAGR